MKAQTWWRRPHADGGRGWNDAARSQGHLGPPDAGRDKEGFSTDAFRGDVTLPAP